MKADDKTVAKVRTELEASSEIPSFTKRTDARGRYRPARAKPRAKSAMLAEAVLGRSARAASPTTHGKRTTALDVLEVWMQLPPEEDRRVLNSIGLKRILAGFPEEWLPALEEWIEQRRSSPPTIDAKAQGGSYSQQPGQSDLAIPHSLDRRPRCAQCNSAPDGTEHHHKIRDRLVLLHDECVRFYQREHPAIVS